MYQLLLLSLLFCAASSATLGQFEYSTSFLNTSRDGFCMVQYGDWIYAIGGYAGSKLLPTVERAVLSSSGKLDTPFYLLSSELVVPRDAHSCVVIGNEILVLGGETSSGDIDSIERATINVDGTLTPFSLDSISLPVNVSSAAAVFDERTRYLFVIGGYYRVVGTLDTVYAAYVSTTGALNAFKAVSTLKHARYGHRALVLGDSLIVLGGGDVSIEKSAIGCACSSFEEVASLSVIRQGLSIGYENGFLYAVGGLPSGSRPLGTVEVLSVSEDGVFGTSMGVVVPNITLQYPRAFQEGGIFGGQLAVVGGAGTLGADILSSVEVATISA